MIVLDVEIKKGILGPRDAPLEGIEYCGGWRDFRGMGVACVCAYETETHATRVFLEEDLTELQAYVAGKPTGGFNTRRFDLPLLEHHGIRVDQAQHYDALERIWLSLGLDPDRFSPRTHGGWSLDRIMTATFGLSKSGAGALAPVWWQQGRRGKVIDYCCRDVYLEAMLITHLAAGKEVRKDAEGQPVRVA